MQLFPEAEQLDSAVLLRDADAFKTASQENTYQAYENFFTTYPEAVDFNEAQKRYHQLLYNEKTATGKLADLQAFLKEFPNTWHRDETELSIYRIITGRNTLEAYRKFIAEYPKSKLVSRASRYAYDLVDTDSRQMLMNELGYSQTVQDSLNNLATNGSPLCSNYIISKE